MAMETYTSSKTQSWLVWFYRGLLVLGVMILLGRAFDLQIVKGGYYRDLSENKRIRRINIAAPRGEIQARGGEILAGSREIKKSIIFDAKEGVIKKEATSDTPADEIIIEAERAYDLGQNAAHITGYIGEA